MQCMDRDVLEEYLREGLSLAEIGRREQRHESTVAYWLGRHGLTATNRLRHAPRGGLDRELLARLVEEGMSISQIAEAVSRSKATVRHWLRRHGLDTSEALRRRERAEALRAGAADGALPALVCRRHGPAEFFLDPGGRPRCRRCRSEAVSRRRRRVKAILVAEAGGACHVCGYARDPRALHFHHVDPALKRLEINARGAGLALERLREEARKCVLLCANCHAEAETLASGREPS